MLEISSTKERIRGTMTVNYCFQIGILVKEVFLGNRCLQEDNSLVNTITNPDTRRQHDFTALSEYNSLKIVATITGHGFNQDQANCAEFCDHEHHYYLNGNTAYEWHPIVYDSQGCEKEVDDGVVANQFGSWPFGRAGWCAGQDVKQWVYDITDWVDNSSTNNLVYNGIIQRTGICSSGYKWWWKRNSCQYLVGVLRYKLSRRRRQAFQTDLDLASGVSSNS